MKGGRGREGAREREGGDELGYDLCETVVIYSER